MTQAPLNEAALMFELFRGSDQAHGRSELTKDISSKGKHETKSWLEKKAVTVEDWESHLSGERGIGIPPLNSENKVRWGAVDVDVYEGLDLAALNARIVGANLPVVLCRSKSGGPHLYLFVADWVPAKTMIEKLDAIAGFLGFGTSEIFPKQVAVSNDGKDFGSWINMPYFGGTKYLRYGLNEKGEAIADVGAFAEYCRSRTLSVEAFNSFTPPEVGDVFPDGPPCLNRIFADKPSDFRNVLLSNAAVYAKKAFPKHGGKSSTSTTSGSPNL